MSRTSGVPKQSPIGGRLKTAVVATLLAMGGAHATAMAQVAVSPAFETETDSPDDSSPQQRSTESGTDNALSLTLFAAAAPDPLLKYRFWPAAQDRLDSDASALISRAILMKIQSEKNSPNAFQEKYVEWGETPIDQLPVRQVRNALSRYSHVFEQLERTENLMRMDYDLQLRDLSTSEMVAVLLPEFQEARDLARMLDLRARLAIAEGRWDDAMADLRIGFRLAEAIGSGSGNDFLVARLVGFAIAGVMMNTIEDAITQPDCPNLYWALATLPADRLFEIRESIEFEASLLTRMTSGIEELPEEPIGAEAARVKIRQIAEETRLLVGNTDGQSFPARLAAGMYVVMFAEQARDFLADTTDWGQRAYRLSPSEAVLRATILQLERARDSWLAWALLPPNLWNDDKVSRAMRMTRRQPAEMDYAAVLAGLLTPAIEAAQRASLRGRQQQHFLATIEAIRMHASQAGEFPASLDDLDPVPAWNDPLGDGDFQYERQAPDQATLQRAERFSGDQETTFSLRLKAAQ